MARAGTPDWADGVLGWVIFGGLGAILGILAGGGGAWWAAPNLERKAENLERSGRTDGGFSGDGGPATVARLDRPTYLAVDAARNLYIADSGNRRVRGVDRNGIITTAATGTLVGVPFVGLGGLAVDAAGNLYIADAFGVHRMDPTGTITERVGRGSSSGDGVNVPEGLAVDAAGNLYIADAGDHRVRRVDPTGVITTVAGTGEEGSSGDGGPATAAQLADPGGLALDAAGNLYIADYDRLRRVDPDGIITTVASLGEGPSFVNGVAMDAAGNLYVGQYSPHAARVVRMDPAGVITTVAGGSSTELSFPIGLAVDPAGNLYIADSGHHRVLRVDPAGHITTVAGTR